MDLEWVLSLTSLSGKREGHLRHRHREEAEDEGGDWNYMQPPAKEHQEPPEIRRGRKDSLLELVEGAWVCQHFDLRLLGFQSVSSVVLRL